MTTSSIVIVYLCFLLYSVSGLFIGHINRLAKQIDWLARKQYTHFPSFYAWSTPSYEGQSAINKEMQYYHRPEYLEEVDEFEWPEPHSRLDQIRKAAQRLQITIDTPTRRIQL